MKSPVQLRKPYGQGTFSRIKNARYIGWEDAFDVDAFDVEFVDGLCFLEPHASVRKANRISAKAVPVRVEADEELGSYFKVTYDTGEVAEVGPTCRWCSLLACVTGPCRFRGGLTIDCG